MHSYFWTIAEFCDQELLPFLFADAEDDRQQYTMVVHNVAAELRTGGQATGDPTAGTVSLDGAVIRDFDELVDAIEDRVLIADGDLGPWAGRAIGAGHGQRVHPAPRRRAAATSRHLVRADVARPQTALGVAFEDQVTVVDIHNLNDRAKRFVVGVILRKAFEAKERSGHGPAAAVRRARRAQQVRAARRLQPDQGDPARHRRARPLARHHARSACQQTASEVERRIIANSAIRVVGRLDAAEAGRREYGFLPAVQRQRATLLKPGTMFVSQPGAARAARSSSSRSRPGPPAPSEAVAGSNPPRHRPPGRPARRVSRT